MLTRHTAKFVLVRQISAIISTLLTELEHRQNARCLKKNVKQHRQDTIDSSLYVTSRGKSTTPHLEISDEENLSTPSFAAGPVKSNQMLIYTLSVLYSACSMLLV